MPSIVILGAGLTGISAAYHLEQLGYDDYAIFEKETTVGGLCRSLRRDGFTFDLTGHLLHLNNDYVRTLVDQTVDKSLFATVNRRSAIYSYDRYTQYPYQINLYGLPIDVIVACIEGFVQRPSAATTPTMFTDWVMSSFGAGLARHFFFPYQEKIFDLPVNELSASWTGRFVPATSLPEMLRGALAPSQEAIGYNAQFFYPTKGGIDRWVDGFAAHIKKPINTGHEVVAIDGKNKRVIFANGIEEPYEQLISTLPLDLLLNYLSEGAHTNLRSARAHLRCARVINLNIGIRRPELAPYHWSYYPEGQFPFYRIGFPSQLVPAMAPAGHSSISAEISLLNRSPQEREAKIATARQAIHKLFALNEHEIATEVIIDIPHGYVIFDRWRDDHLPQLLADVTTHYQIQSIGRYGAWKYASMQEAILDGQAGAQKALQSCGVAC